MNKPRPGRPTVSAKLAKASLLSVRFSADERRTLERAAKREGLKLSAWARRALLVSAFEVQGGGGIGASLERLAPSRRP